jgi:putative addiction module component (TIGR02574 family)
MTAKQIEAAAVKLPKRARERLVRVLLETIPPKPGEEDPEILAAWIQEAERRDRELDEGKEVALPYEEVTAELRVSLRRR